MSKLIKTLLGLIALCGYFLAGEDSYQRALNEPGAFQNEIVKADAEQAREYPTLRNRP